MVTETAKTLGSNSINHRRDTFAPDLCLINVTMWIVGKLSSEHKRHKIRSTVDPIMVWWQFGLNAGYKNYKLASKCRLKNVLNANSNFGIPDCSITYEKNTIHKKIPPTDAVFSTESWIVASRRCDDASCASLCCHSLVSTAAQS